MAGGLTELERVQAAFAAREQNPLAIDMRNGALLDSAVLHLFDWWVRPFPDWARARFESLKERGFIRFNPHIGAQFDADEAARLGRKYAGDWQMVWAGAEEAARQAGRESAHEGPGFDDVCPCAICNAAREEFDGGQMAQGREDRPPEAAEIVDAARQGGEGAAHALAGGSAAQNADYRAFLEGKIKLAPFEGIEVSDASINPALAPHARAIVRWALRGGRRAIFASFGLHKTAIQLEIMRQITRETDGPTLIVLPLGVRQEFMNEAETRFTGRCEIRLKFIRRAEEIERGTPGAPIIYLTNYETIRDGKLDPALFVAASLDEAAVLRSYGSITFQSFMTLFERVRYRFVATATPSPNRLKELIHYAGFLGIADTGHLLTRYFQRNSEQANDLTLYEHREFEFWTWMASWAVFAQKPSDLSFPDDGFVLPPLNIVWHEVQSDLADAGAEKDGQFRLFRDAALGLQAAAHEKRDSMHVRIDALMRILVAETDPQAIVWVHLNDEQDAVEARLGDLGISYVSLRGTQPLDERERLIAEWKDGQACVFLSKPEMYGAGVNMQQSHTMAFAGLNYSFHDIIQAVHRIQRFGQQHPCTVHFIHSEAEREIVREVKRKWGQHEEMQAKMGEIIRKYGLDHAAMAAELRRSIGIDRVGVKSERFDIAHNDCVQEARRRESNSVDLIVSSIPFASQYEYVEAYEDFGHVESNEHFWAQMDFLTPELLRALKPGRRLEVHVKDRVLFGNVTDKGAPTISPFHAEAIFHYQRHGFDYLGMVTVVTDVVRENGQTYRLGFSENAKDATRMGSGCPEYIIHLRKPQTDRSKGYADDRVPHEKPLCRDKDGNLVPFDRNLHPVPGTGYSRARWQTDAHAFWRSSGNRLLTPEEIAQLGPGTLASAFPLATLARVYDYEFHVSVGEHLDATGALPSGFMALPIGSHNAEVWTDIVRMHTLNSEQSKRRVEQHVCPLQLDIVERLIGMYSAPDELVYDPFMGIGTVPYVAIKMGRKGGGSELNGTSFLDAAHYCQAAEKEHGMPSLFDLLPNEGEAA